MKGSSKPIKNGSSNPEHIVNNVDDILITSKLAHRPARTPDYAAENQALVMLAQELAVHPDNALQQVAELAILLCRADSAGIAILEPDETGEVFRCHAAAGTFPASLRGTFSCGADPCRMLLSRNDVLLLDKAGCLSAFSDVEPPIYETLLSSWEPNGKPAGILWASSHTLERQFDAEDARVLRNLTGFAAAAWQLLSTVRQTKAHRANLDQGINERTQASWQANQALEDSQKRLLRTVSIDTVGVLFFRLDGTITDTNAAFARMTGYSREELLQDIHWDVLTAPEFWPPTEHAAAELAATGETLPYEKQLVRKDGSRWWSLCAPKRLRGRGPASECVEFIIDITAHKNAEEAMRKSEAAQAFLLKVSDVLRPLIDPVEIQSKAAHLLGEHLAADRTLYTELTGEEIIVHQDYARGVPSMVGRYSMAAFVRHLMAVCGHGDSYSVDDVATDPRLSEQDRSILAGANIASFAGVALTKNNQFVATLGVHSITPRIWRAEDIQLICATVERTWEAIERARAESALRDSEQRYRTLFDSIDEGFQLAQIITGEEGQVIDMRFLELNPAWERTTGISSTMAKSKTLMELLPDLDRSWLDTFAKVALQGESIRFEEYVAPVHRWFDCYAVPFGPKQDGRFALVFRDITERKRAEQAIQDSLAEKEALLKEVHHRVKNNLQVITSLLNMQARQITDPEVLAQFDEARNRVFSVAAIHELLYRSSSFAAIDLVAYARQLVPDLIRFYGAERLIRTAISGNGVTIDLERAMPYGLLLNELVSNVCKHAFPLNQTGDLNVSIHRDPDQITLRVADTGVGLPEGFDDRRTTSLGLQLVHRLARQLGGTATIQSCLGAGTLVTICIAATTDWESE